MAASDAIPTNRFLNTVGALVGVYDDWNPNIAGAIIFAESKGRVGATHKNSDGSIDRGLMQINSVHSQYDADKLVHDAGYNVAAGHEIWKAAGGSFSPWTTYKTQAYKTYLDSKGRLRPGLANFPVLNSEGGLVGQIGDVATAPLDAAEGAVNAATDGVNAIADVVKSLANASTWARLGKGWLGGVFVVLGVGGIVFTVANKAGAMPVAKAAAKVIK